MNDRNNLRRHDNRSLDENRGHYGESGLSSDCFDNDAYADDDSREETAIRLEIIRALMDTGFEPGMVDDRLFQEYLKKVADGPGAGWEPYRQARFTLQTMNRCGVIDWPVRTAVDTRDDTEKTDVSNQRDSQEKERPSETENEELAPHGNLTFELIKDHFRDYRQLSVSEIKDNLIVCAGILGVVALAAAAVAIGVMLRSPGAAAGGGAISVAALVAVTARLAGRYHHRFGLPYRMLRLLVCLALLFTKAAWVASRELWMLVYNTTQLAIPIPAFGVTVAIVLLLSAVWTHITLCRTSQPSKALFLGWLEGLELTFALGALMFGAVYK